MFCTRFSIARAAEHKGFSDWSEHDLAKTEPTSSHCGNGCLIRTNAMLFAQETVLDVLLATLQNEVLGSRSLIFILRCGSLRAMTYSYRNATMASTRMARRAGT